MQLSQSLSLLFMSLLLALSISFSNIADAKPLVHAEFGKIITLPVKRYAHINVTNVHPFMAFQQHINHGLSRLAHMNGSPQPSREQLTENLERRRAADESDIPNIPGLPGDTYPPGTIPRLSTVSGYPAGKASKPLRRSPVTPPNQLSAQKSLGLNVHPASVSYLATIQIGTPLRDFSILMDSASADFWVGSEQCKSTEGGDCGNHVFLGPESSSSFNNSGQAFKATYGRGTAAGTVIRDDISIAGLTLNGHTFGVAAVESKEFSADSVPFDGLMGLAQSKLSVQNTPTPVEALANAGLIDAPIVSYKLPREEDGKNDGEITFGGLDATKFDPETLVTLDNINPYGYWVARVDDVTINGENLRLANFQDRAASLDPGTTLAILPAEDAIAIHKKVPGAASDGQGGITMPCDTSTVISLTFGNRAFDINLKDFSFSPLSGGSYYCHSGIVSGGAGQTYWLLGTTFLKNVYFSTNADKNTLSLAKLV